MESEHETESADREEKPPFGTWTHWYLAVILTLLVLIILFYTFTRAYR